MGACESNTNMTDHIAQSDKQKTPKNGNTAKAAKVAKAKKTKKTKKTVKTKKAKKADQAEKTQTVKQKPSESVSLQIELQTYKRLVSMGHDEDLSRSVSKKFNGNYSKCINYLSQKTKSEQTEKTEKAEKTGKVDKSSKVSKGSKASKASKATKASKASKPSKPSKATKSEKIEKGKKGQQQQNKVQINNKMEKFEKKKIDKKKIEKPGSKQELKQNEEDKKSHKKQQELPQQTVQRKSFSSKKKKSTMDLEEERLKQIKIDALSRNIEILQRAQQRIDDLKREIEDLKTLNAEQKTDIEDREDVIYKTQDDIKEMSLTILELENQVNGKEYEMNSIQDSLYKVQGDSISKLKYNKQSKKDVVFVNKINHLFYCEAASDIKTKTKTKTKTTRSEQKLIIVKDIIFHNNTISSHMNKAWFLIIGEKRSALFIADSDLIRDKWVDFIKKGLNSSNNNSNNSNMNENNNNNNKDITGYLGTNMNGKYNRNRSSFSSITISTNNLVMANQSNYTISRGSVSSINSPRSAVGCQSPVSYKVIGNDEFKTCSVKFDYPSIIRHSTVCNNGHSVQININQKQNECLLVIHNEIYLLKQFHFHLPSEHNINNNQYEMEMHLVHNKKDDDDDIIVLSFIFTATQKYIKPKMELNKNKTHYVVSNGDEMIKRKNNENNKNKLKTMMESDVYLEESDDDETDTEFDENEEIGNEFLAQFWEQLPLKKTKAQIPLNNPISFDYLLETSGNNFIKSIKTNEFNIDLQLFQYLGPLRTPPYTEGVQWLISKRTHFINNKQLHRLKKIWYSYL